MSIMQQDFSYMDDRALQAAMQFAQRSNDTPTFLGLMAEANKRRKMRSEAQGMQAGQQMASEPPTTVADKIMSGIANLSSGEHEYANGGIVAFSEGGTSRVGFSWSDDPSVSPLEALGMANQARAGVVGGRVTQRDVYLANTRSSPVYDDPTLRNIGDAISNAYDRTRSFFTSDPNYGNEGRGDRQLAGITPAAKTAPAPTAPVAPEPAYGADFRRGRYLGGISPSSPASAKTGAGSGEASVSASAKKATATAPTVAPAEGGLPTLTPSAVEKTMTAEEIKAKAKAMAAGDDEKVDAIFAKAAERAEKRRAELEAETKPTKGLLGLSMSPEMRKVLRDAGIGAMTSKSTTALGGIGEGLSKAASEYDAGRMRRNEQTALLDAAEEKRGIAALAAKQGNLEAARKNIVEADALHQQAVGNALKRDENATHRYTAEALARHQLAQEALQGRQIDATLQAARIHAAAAGRNPQLELYRALGGGDPRAGFQFAQTVKTDPAAELASWKAYAADPMKLELLKVTNPEMHAAIVQKINAELGRTSGTIAKPSAGWGPATVK